MTCEPDRRWRGLAVAVATGQPGDVIRGMARKMKEVRLPETELVRRGGKVTVDVRSPFLLMLRSARVFSGNRKDREALEGLAAACLGRLDDLPALPVVADGYVFDAVTGKARRWRADLDE